MAIVRAGAGPAVTWRDGVHLAGTPIWCDARRARDVCFVSCGHAITGARHGQLIAKAETLALLGEDAGSSRLPLRYGKPFTLGTVRLEAVRSGHALGSASLLAEVSGHRVLYAGPVNLAGGGLGGLADTRPCDTVVLAADYGAPRFDFPPLAEVLARVSEFAAGVTATGGVAVLLVSSPGKAFDVASRLADELPAAARAGTSFFAHRSLYDAGRRLRRTHPALPRLRRFTGRAPAGHILLWPVSRRPAVPHDLPAASRVALVSGLACDDDAVAALAVDAAFAWSNQADFADLMRYIDSCRAHTVFATHRHGETLAAALAGSGRTARAMGPPLQMPLFAGPESG